MRLRKRIMIVLSAMLIMMMCLGVNVSAASSPKLSKTSLMLITGNSYTLKVTGTSSKVKWSVSNTKVISVKNGKVTGKSQGTAYVYATVGKKKLKCKVNVYDSYISPISNVKLSAWSSKKISFKAYNVDPEDIVIIVEDENVVQPVGCSINGDTVTVTLYGVGSGSTEMGFWDDKNPAMERDFTVTVSGSAKADNYDYDDGNKNGSSSDSYADEVIKLVNKERSKRGLDPLTTTDKLRDAAEKRAKELGKSFSHTRPNGTSCFTVLGEYGISYSAAGENIANGQDTPEEAMESWMNSEMHKKNILNPDYTGIGVAYDEDTDSWVQIFIG
ncbi:MAG: Ig-like domain-containing protein [Oscillospiraceae bacterium]|nr:Ig-like domain-containing protein [Oscillospiraceae bacterium]